jgi:hypothetical protein
MCPTEPAFKMAMFPWMFDVEANVVAGIVMPDPFARVMNVRRIWMIVAIAMVPSVGFVRVAVVGRRTVLRDISAAVIMVIATIVVIPVIAMILVLGDRRQRQKQT